MRQHIFHFYDPVHEFQICFHVNSWNGNWMKDTGYLIVVICCSGKRWPFSLVKPTGISDETEIGGHCHRTWWPGFCGCSYSWFYTPCPFMGSDTTKTFTIDALPWNHGHWSGITGMHFFRFTRLQCGSWPCSETFDCSRWKDFQKTGTTNFQIWMDTWCMLAVEQLVVWICPRPWKVEPYDCPTCLRWTVQPGFSRSCLGRKIPEYLGCTMWWHDFLQCRIFL